MALRSDLIFLDNELGINMIGLRFSNQTVSQSCEMNVQLAPYCIGAKHEKKVIQRGCFGYKQRSFHIKALKCSSLVLDMGVCMEVMVRLFFTFDSIMPRIPIQR